GFEHDPVEVGIDFEFWILDFGVSIRSGIPALSLIELRAGSGWLHFADRLGNRLVTGVAQLPGIQRRLTGQQFIEQHSQRVDVAPRVDIQSTQAGLFGAHVSGGAKNWWNRVNRVLSIRGSSTALATHTSSRERSDLPPHAGRGPDDGRKRRGDTSNRDKSVRTPRRHQEIPVLPLPARPTSAWS